MPWPPIATLASPSTVALSRLASLGRWLLWCLIAWLAARVIAGSAQLIWQVSHPPMPQAISAFTPPPDSLPPMTNLPWAPVQKASETQGVPLTQLPLTFLGVIRATPLSRSLVVLNTPDGAHVAMAGETIYAEVGLSRITETGLILDNAGRKERLPWPQESPANDGSILTIMTPAATSPREEIHAAWPQATLREVFGADYRQQLLARPERLTPYLTVTPVARGNRLEGYRVDRGDRPTLFAALPFETGDVVTAIDGRPIAELSPAHLAKAFAQSRVTLQLIRDGEPVTLVLESSP